MEALVYDFCQGLSNSSTLAALAPQPPHPHVQFAPTVTSPISSREPPLSLHYHRPFGKTAIQPGLEQITIAIRAPPTFSRAPSPVHDSPSTSHPQTSLPQPDLASSSSDLTTLDLLPHHFDPSTTHTSVPFGQPFADSPATVRLLFDEGSDVPTSDVLDVLYPIFFHKIGCQFPFLSLPSLQTLDLDNPSSQVTAPLLVLAVCALAARFSDDPLIAGNTPGRRLRATRGVPFADKAKEILVPLLAYPSSNTVAALLLLAWHEFGLNSEGALWMYSGIALRMAQDLGLHQDVHRHRKEVGEQQRASDTLLWWSCFILDRALAIGTGRSVTVKDNEISTPLPTSNDVALVSSPCTLPDAAPPPVSPFPFTVQFMLLYGKICETVNLSKLPWRPFQPDSSLSPSQADTNDKGGARTVEDSPSEEAATIFREIEDTITSTYLSLPPDMVFTSANFQRHAARGAGPTFLHLHLWYNCILILLYRPPLLFKKSRSCSLSLADRLAVVNNSCLTIGQLLSCAEIVDKYAYVASPFVNQCFFVAAGAWIQDFRIRTGRNIIATSSEKSGEKAPPVPNSSATILAQVALQNFNLCKNALDRQAEYWLGVGWIAALVDKQGKKQSRTSLQTATAGVDTFVSGEHLATIRKQIGQGFAGARGVPPPPELNDDSWMGMFLAAPSASASDVNMSADDMASFYTCTSMFPEIFGAEGQESLFRVQP